MPLIKHSQEFLEKQRLRREKQEKIKTDENKAKLIDQMTRYVDQVREFRSMDLSDPDELDKYNSLLNTLVRQGVPILEFLTIKEAEFLREILRFAKLSGKFTTNIEDYRLMESIQKKNYNNIFHLTSLKDLGLLSYVRSVKALFSSRNRSVK